MSHVLPLNSPFPLLCHLHNRLQMTFTSLMYSFHPFRVTQSPYYETANSHRSHVFSSLARQHPSTHSSKHPFTHAPFTNPPTPTPTKPPNKRGSLDLLSEHRICRLMDVALHMSQAISPSHSPSYHPLPPWFPSSSSSTSLHHYSFLNRYTF